MNPGEEFYPDVLVDLHGGEMYKRLQNENQRNFETAFTTTGLAISRIKSRLTELND